MSEREQLKIFDQAYRHIGNASRAQAHQQGLWHETFHCWFYTWAQDELVIYFQKRSMQKKDFPGQLDITAAGHLLAHETVVDGFREVQEELGIEVKPEEAQGLGVFLVDIALPGFNDREFTNVFLVERTLTAGTFYLQEEEVEGVYPLSLQVFKEIFYGQRDQVTSNGVCQVGGKQFSRSSTFRKSDFCVNAATYYDQLIVCFEKIVEKQSKTLD